jgi:hypothetical protein
LEYSWVGSEEEIEETVDEGGIETRESQLRRNTRRREEGCIARIPQKKDYRLNNEHVERASQIALNKNLQVDFSFFLLCVYSPVFGTST